MRPRREPPENPGRAFLEFHPCSCDALCKLQKKDNFFPLASQPLYTTQTLDKPVRAWARSGCLYRPIVAMRVFLMGPAIVWDGTVRQGPILATRFSGGETKVTFAGVPKVAEACTPVFFEPR